VADTALFYQVAMVQLILSFFKSQGIAIAGFVLSGVMFWLWQGAKEDLTQQIERCNTEKALSVAEAEKVAREALQSSLDGRIRQLEKEADNAERARQIAEEARLEAESRPVQVREVIKRVREQDACLDTELHPSLLSCLRADQNCGEASPG